MHEHHVKKIICVFTNIVSIHVGYFTPNLDLITRRKMVQFVISQLSSVISMFKRILILNISGSNKRLGFHLEEFSMQRFSISLHSIFEHIQKLKRKKPAFKRKSALPRLKRLRMSSTSERSPLFSFTTR